MPITFKVAPHESKSYKQPTSGIERPTDILKTTWECKQKGARDPESGEITKVNCKDLIRSSLEDVDLQTYFPQTHGFVHAIVSAYNGHHNLVIRPDDVWIAILSQFYLYVTAHAEELRSKFVAHEGKEEIVVEVIASSRYTVSYDWMAKEMTKKMKEKIVDPDLENFIIPDFSTTTPVDTAVGCMMMMGTLKHYFNYRCMIRCGIPSITLLGTKEDYEGIYRRLDKLHEFGDEPRVFAALLRPILREFIDVFDDTSNDGNSSPRNIDFWNRICHYHPGGSGPDYLSGWASAFCVWNNEGEWCGPQIATFNDPVSEEERLKSARFYGAQPKSRRGIPGFTRSPPALFLGDVRYPVVTFMSVPNGFCEVDVIVDEYGTEYDCAIVAGHIGFTVYGEKNDTLQPSPQWFMFEKGKVVQNPNARTRESPRFFE